MFCIRCGYAVDGVRDNRCPECGRPFYPEFPRTYRQTPHPRILPSPGLVLAVLVSALPVAICVVGGYLLCVWLGFLFFPDSNLVPIPFLVPLWPLFLLLGLLLGRFTYKAIRR